MVIKPITINMIVLVIPKRNPIASKVKINRIA